MFIIKYWDHPVVLPKCVRNFLEETSTRIQVLLFVVIGIFAMLTDADDSIHRNPRPPDRDCFFNRIEDRHVVFFREGSSEIPIGELLDIHRRER